MQTLDNSHQPGFFLDWRGRIRLSYFYTLKRDKRENKMKKLRNGGFTLVELAIVLVIVGLLVGGVLQGQELIKQATINKHIASIREVDLALKAFQAKYDGLPGDIRRPERFFPDCGGIAGDGNGVISQDYGENLCVWFHLYHAGLYHPIGFNNENIEVEGFMWAKWPVIPIGAEVAWLVNQVGSDASSAYKNINSNALRLAEGTDAFSPPTMYDIDRKMDDSKAGTGVILAMASGFAELDEETGEPRKCFDNEVIEDIYGQPITTLDSNYVISEPSKTCCLIYKMK